MRSIRFRLTASLVIAIGLLIVMATLVLRVNLTRWLESEFDASLEASARALVTLTKQEGDTVELDFADEFMPEFESAEDPHYFEIWLDGETLLERSHSFGLDAERSAASLTRVSMPSGQRPRFLNIILPDGRAGRLIRIDFVPQRDDRAAPATEVASEREPQLDPTRIPPGSQHHTATVLVARERESLDRHISELGWSLVGFTGLLLITLAAIVAVTLKAGLRPLDRLGLQVRTLEAETLHQQLDLDSLPQELAPVIQQFVELLARLEAAFRRERQLTGDIAHELKTPIAELRNLCEVGGRWPDDPEMAGRFFDDARHIALQMERIVVDLRALARHDEGALQASSAPVPLAQALAEAWAPVADLARDKGLQLDARVPGEAMLETDPDKFRLILSNLVANAVSYSRPGTTIACRFESSVGRASLTVANHPQDLDPADLPLMFDRFWRKDAARTGGRSVGLGLSIVKAFADLLGFEIQASLDDGRLTITLSRAA